MTSHSKLIKQNIDSKNNYNFSKSENHVVSHNSSSL